MRKPVVLSAPLRVLPGALLGALLGAILGLAACAPLSISDPFTSDSDLQQTRRSAPIHATYYPTVTPIPTWTPPPQPTALPAPTVAPTLEPTLVPPTDPPAAQLTIAELPLLTTAQIATVSLPTLPPTAIPLPTVAAPTPVPLAPALDAPRTAAAAASDPGCPPVSSSSFELVPIEGAAYKNNSLTDENPDLRLSILGYTPASAPPGLVEYNGATDSDPPKLYGLFAPTRLPSIIGVYQRRDWTWNDAGGPPYGWPSGANNDWPASVIEVSAAPGEAIYIPTRNPAIWTNDIVAMVLYAGARELTLAYTRQDSVTAGYVIHLLNFCVDANLVAQYQAQVSAGRRATGMLPGVRNGQPIGVALGSLIVAVRDRGAFLDPRSRKDWW
jgi:hypothetical protein